MRLTWLVGSIAIIACASWAIFPPNDSSDASLAFDLHQPEKPELNTAEQSFDQSVFNASLWNPPQVKQTSTALSKKESPRPKSLRLQLIGISTDGDTLKAAIYDPDSDQLLIVASGQSILGHTVSEITKFTVAITDGSYTHHLQLLGDKGDLWDKGDDGS